MPRFHWLLVTILLIVNEAAAIPPNIVLIVADDLGYGDLGCYGQTLIQTPNIDQLAARGIRFTQAYAGAPVCTSSRAVLMTGLHTGHAPARDNIPHYDTYLQDDHVTIAEILTAAGYRCGGVGKWSLGDAGTVGRATNQGFERWFGYLNQDHAHYYFPGYLDDDEGRLTLPNNWETQHLYSHDLMTTRALEFINSAAEGPFFLYAAYTVPHFSAQSESPTRLPIPSNAPYSKRDWTEAEKNYAAMISKLDRDVGRIVKLLDRLNVSDNTLLLITSDNGPWGSAPQRFRSSGGLRGAKRSLYEGGIRVPLVGYWPQHTPKGVVSDAVIGFQDLMPTFAELASAATPPNIDGDSFASVLLDADATNRTRTLYWDYGHCRDRYDQAVRWGDWKGVRLGKSQPVELYNLKTDPREQQNVAQDNWEVVQHLEGLMQSEVQPHARYPIGDIYRGKKLWHPAWQ